MNQKKISLNNRNHLNYIENIFQKKKYENNSFNNFIFRF